MRAAPAADRVDALLARRTEAGGRWFAAEAERLAALCRALAERFTAGGRLLALGATPAGGRTRATWRSSSCIR